MVCLARAILLFVLADIAVAAIFNGSFLDDLDNGKKDLQIKTRRQAEKPKKGGRSTSSSSGQAKLKNEKSSDQKQSLELSESYSSSSGKKKPKKSGKPKSSRERKGWKKWHRKCTPCPDDMRLKWRDPRIKWICGSYQRARRSFKSLCMMHYRNCQDGTMFTKMADHRCRNSSSTSLVDQGDHFMYDYAVQISDESSKSKKSNSESSSSQKESSSESWNSDKFGPRDMDSEAFNKRINVLNAHHR